MKGGAAAGFVSWLFYRFEITEHVPRLVAASLQGQARLKTSCLRFSYRFRLNRYLGVLHCRLTDKRSTEKLASSERQESLMPTADPFRSWL